MIHADLKTELSGQDQQTYDAIFRHPTSGNIEWHGLLALFGHLGEVIDEPNGKVKLIRNGHALTLRPNGKDAQREEVSDIRKFLQISGAPADDETKESGDFLLVLVHSEARIYRAESADSKPVHVEPTDPHGWEKHADNNHDVSSPPTSALHHEFFDKVATVLAGANRILIYGDGKGSGQEFDRLMDDLKRHHPELAERIVGNEAIDLSHMSDPQILAKARDQFAQAAPAIIREVEEQV